MSHSRKILIIRPDHLGDVILSLPVAEALKNQYPDSLIIYLSAPGVEDLQGMVYYVDGWIIDRDDRGQRRSISALAALFRGGGFDTLIELKPSFRTAVAGFLSHVQTRIGTSRRIYSIFYNHWVNLHRRASGKHQTDLDLAMLKPMGIKIEGLLPNLKINVDCLAKAKSLLNIDPKSYIVIHPGSSGSAPNWPMGNYMKLARLITDQTNYKVVLTGLELDASANFGQFINLCGKTDLEALTGAIYGAELYISGSTGPLHLADALGIRCMSFFVNHISIGPDRWGPRRNMANVLMPANPCRCARLSDCHCLEQVTPEMAFNKMKDVLKESECGTAKK